MKLFTQYNRITLWVLAGFFLISSIVYYFLMRDLLFQELDKSMVKIEKRIEDYVQENHSFPDVESLDDLHVTYVETAQGGSPVFRLITPTRGKNSDHIRELDFYLDKGGRWYKVTVSRKLEGIKATAQMVVKMAVITLLLVIVAFLIVNRLVFRRLWRPFYESIAAIGRFQLGKHTLTDLPSTRIEEFNFMNDQFKGMAAKINREYIVLKEFTENASHEMQTPLAVIRSKLDLAIQDQHLSQEQSDTLRSAYASLKKLASLNRALLLIAKISNNQYSENAVLDIKEKLQDKILQFQELWEGKLTISSDLGEAEISANPDLVDIMLNNLFSNAGRHNVSAGKVMVRLDGMSLEIKNTGRPAPLDETRMFQRFYKGSVQEESNGLGLSIVKEICDLSGITLSYAYSAGLHGFTLQWNGAGRQTLP